MKDTLLIIEDNPNNLNALRDLLINAGFKVLTAEDGEEGLQVTEYGYPDLILLDVMMPGINGFEVCQYLKSQPHTKDIPIIFITALISTTDKIKGFQSGAADYITKPFEQEEVLARIRTHLTLRKQQQQLQEYTAELEKRNMELDAFAHMVAHDLKNPLNSIVKLTGLFVERCAQPLDAMWMKKLRFVEKSGQRAINTIHALLTLAGVSRQTQIEIKPLDMSPLLDKIIPSIIEQYPGKIDLPERWPLALGYAPWIEEVWSNYLSNGLKYAGQSPRLQLGADIYTSVQQQTDTMIRFWVRDNGPGLTPKEQAQLFTPFTRLHKDRADGHGLGLSIVQQIVEKLGGQVGVESELAQGSLFYFTLPAI